MDNWQIVLRHCLLEAAIYIAGFPCKAFSRLRQTSEWLSDEAAKPFYGCIENIKTIRPVATHLHSVSFPCLSVFDLVCIVKSNSMCKAALLENVLGIKKVLPDVKAHIQEQLPSYKLAVVTLSPKLG